MKLTMQQVGQGNILLDSLRLAAGARVVDNTSDRNPVWKPGKAPATAKAAVKAAGTSREPAVLAKVAGPGLEPVAWRQEYGPADNWRAIKDRGAADKVELAAKREAERAAYLSGSEGRKAAAKAARRARQEAAKARGVAARPLVSRVAAPSGMDVAVSCAAQRAALSGPAHVGDRIEQAAHEAVLQALLKRAGLL